MSGVQEGRTLKNVLLDGLGGAFEIVKAKQLMKYDLEFNEQYRINQPVMNNRDSPESPAIQTGSYKMPTLPGGAVGTIGFGVAGVLLVVGIVAIAKKVL